MDMGFIQSMIGNIFFPIVMVVYFMSRFEKILQHNTRAMESLQRLVTETVMVHNINKRGGSYNG